VKARPRPVRQLKTYSKTLTKTPSPLTTLRSSKIEVWATVARGLRDVRRPTVGIEQPLINVAERAPERQPKPRVPNQQAPPTPRRYGWFNHFDPGAVLPLDPCAKSSMCPRTTFPFIGAPWGRRGGGCGRQVRHLTTAAVPGAGRNADRRPGVALQKLQIFRPAEEEMQVGPPPRGRQIVFTLKDRGECADGRIPWRGKSRRPIFDSGRPYTRLSEFFFAGWSNAWRIWPRAPTQRSPQRFYPGDRLLFASSPIERRQHREWRASGRPPRRMISAIECQDGQAPGHLSAWTRRVPHLSTAYPRRSTWDACDHRGVVFFCGFRDESPFMSPSAIGVLRLRNLYRVPGRRGMASLCQLAIQWRNHRG